MEVLLVSCLLMLAGCGPMDGDKEKPSTETRRDFLSEFGERTGSAGKGYLTLQDDGTLRYQEEVNTHCIFDYTGYVEVVTAAAEDQFDVTYRYTKLMVGHRACRPGEKTCSNDFATCQKEETKRNGEIGKLKKVKVKKGSSAIALTP